MNKQISKQDSTVRKYLSTVAGLLIMLCTGILYMWSVFQPHVVAEFGWSAGDVGMTSNIMMAAFVAGNIISGFLQQKHSPRIIICVGCILFAAGMFLTSRLNGGTPGMIYLTYGLVSGVGCGIAYNTVLSALQKWYPSRKGLITGLSVGTFGAATVILSPIVNKLLEGKGVTTTFMILSFAFLIVGCVASLFVSKPSVEYYMGQTAKVSNSNNKQYTPGEMVKTPMFWLIILSLFAATAPYMVLAPYIKTLAADRGLTKTLALATVMVTGIANACGRLICPALSDKFSKAGTMIGCAIISCVACVLLIFANGPMYLVAVFLITFAYGGSSGLNPVVSTELFGATHSGINYGIVLIGLACSSITFGKIASSVGTTSADGFGVVFIACAFVSLIPVVAMLVLRKVCKKMGKEI